MQHLSQSHRVTASVTLHSRDRKETTIPFNGQTVRGCALLAATACPAPVLAPCARPLPMNIYLHAPRGGFLQHRPQRHSSEIRHLRPANHRRRCTIAGISCPGPNGKHRFRCRRRALRRNLRRRLVCASSGFAPQSRRCSNRQIAFLPSSGGATKSGRSFGTSSIPQSRGRHAFKHRGRRIREPITRCRSTSPQSRSPDCSAAQSP